MTLGMNIIISLDKLDFRYLKMSSPQALPQFSLNKGGANLASPIGRIFNAKKLSLDSSAQ
jgi:hypothetical protein